MVVLALVLTGCGGGAEPDDGPGPITARSVAAVAPDHLPDDTSSRRASYVDRTDPRGYVGAELRYAEALATEHERR